MKRADLPPVEFLVKARQVLLPPGPGMPETRVQVDAGPQWGLFEMTFVVRQYSNGSWVWEINTSKCLNSPAAPGSESPVL
jgi:hypothetical protein